MNTLTIELPEGILSEGTPSSESLAKEVLIAVAIEWYREGRISQGQGALVAKMSRAEFLDELFRAKVPACQVTAEELMEEVDRAVEANRQRVAANPAVQGRTT
jgi:predicted HTH domain antitoxin